MLLPTQFIFIKRYRGKKPTKHELLTEGKTADDLIWVWEPVIGAQGMQHFKKRTQTYWDKNWTKFWEGFYHSESIFPQQTKPNQSWGNEFNNLNNINNIFYYYHFFYRIFCFRSLLICFICRRCTSQTSSKIRGGEDSFPMLNWKM